MSTDQAKRNLYVLWIGCFMAACSFSLVMPFLPRFIAELGIKGNLYAWSGWTYAITFVASAVMAPIWGNLADRYGRKPMILRSGLTIGTIYLLMSFVTNPYQLFGLRMLNGAFSGFIPSSIALIATNTPEHAVGRTLALLQTGIAAGTILGPMVGGTLADLVGIRTSMLVGSVLMWIATALVFFTVKERITASTQARTSPLRDLKMAFSHRTLLALLIAAMMVNASIQSLEPILTQLVPTLRMEAPLTHLVGLLFGRSDAHSFIAGFIFSVPAIASLLTAARWARVGEEIGYARLLAIGLGVAGLIALPQALVTTTGMLIGLRALYGLMTAAVQPAINAALAGAVHPSFRGRAFGINTSALYLGSVLGPTVGGYVADGFGPRVVFIFTGALLLVSSAWVYLALVVRPPETELVGAPAAGEETAL